MPYPRKRQWCIWLLTAWLLPAVSVLVSPPEIEKAEWSP